MKPSGPYFGHSETLGLDLSKLIPLAIAAIRQDMALTSVRSAAEFYPDYLAAPGCAGASAPTGRRGSLRAERSFWGICSA